MKLENQVVSLDLAKKLKELGVKQESDFYWCQLAPNVIKVFCSLCREHRDFGSYDRLCSAFTVAELGKLIPGRLQIDRFTNGTWGVYWLKGIRHDELDQNHSEKANTEADARAKMLIYLLENKLIN